MSADNLAGKSIVVTAGWTREDIDGVRHYANHSRPEGHGFAVAAQLAKRGASVTIVAPKTVRAAPADCALIHELKDGTALGSADSVLRAVDAFVAQTPCDAVLCLASAASIRPVERSKNKLKIKSLETSVVSMPVMGNVDTEVRAQAWRVPVLGYTAWQEKFSSADVPPWLEALSGEIFAPPAPDEPSVLSDGDASFAQDIPNALSGKRVLLTSGRTEELVTATGDIITNFSSGRQGCELANAFSAAGARVVFVAGPSSFLPEPKDNTLIVSVASAKDMLAACEESLPADVFVGVAAVADFGCAQPYFLHLAKGQTYDMVLDKNPDILSFIGHHPALRPDVVVGFAAETDPKKILGYAKEKLVVKNADLICANLVGPDAKHGEDQNQIMFIARGPSPRLSDVLSKKKAAETIVREVAARFGALI